MKIVYLHQYFVTPEMGGGTRSYELARRLAAAGHEVHVVTTDQQSVPGSKGWREEHLDGIQVHWTPVRYGNDLGYARRIAAFFAFAWRAARIVPRLKPDIIFATSTPLTVALPAVWGSRRCAVPMVFEVRDLWPEVPIAIGAIRNPLVIWAARWLERFAYRNASRVVALAPGMKEAVVETGYPEEQVVVIPNGADLSAFTLAASVREDMRTKHEWLGQRKMLVYFGALGLINGVDYLVRVAAEMKRIDPDIRFVVLGAGRMEADIRELAERLGVLDESFFMLGKVSKKEVAMWLTASDMSIALITGPRVIWKDATQNKFFDSLAAGRPVANNFDGWQSRIAADEGCGLILDPSDIKTATAQLHAALIDNEWLETAGRIARSLAENRFSRDLHAKQLEDVLQATLAESQVADR